MVFKSKIKFSERELKKFLKWLQEWIDYRGGMANRIDALNIEQKLLWKLRYLRSLYKKGEGK